MRLCCRSRSCSLLQLLTHSLNACDIGRILDDIGHKHAALSSPSGAAGDTSASGSAPPTLAVVHAPVMSIEEVLRANPVRPHSVCFGFRRLFAAAPDVWCL